MNYGMISYFQSGFSSRKCSLYGKLKTPAPPYFSSSYFNVGLPSFNVFPSFIA